MKKIIIKEENAEKIMAAFESKQGRARERKINSFSDLKYEIVGIERRLDGMSKKAMNGTKIEFDFRQQFPSAYKYTPDSTHFVLYFENNVWKIDVDSIGRYTCPNRKSSYGYVMHLSETAKAEILKRYE